MLENILEFNKLFSKGAIKIANMKLCRVIQEYLFYYIPEKCNLDLNFAQDLKDSKVIIINQFSENISDVIGDYFILSFKKTLVIVSQQSISLFKQLLSINPNVLLCFLSNTENIFKQRIQIENQIVDCDSFFMDLISNFSEQIRIRQTSGQKILPMTWKIIRTSIIGFLIKQAFEKLEKNRFLNFREDKENSKEYDMADFIELKNIGCGSTFTATLIYHIEKGELFVMKRPYINDVESSESLKREIENYQKLSHPFIPKYYGTIKDENYLVIEFINGKTLNNIEKEKLDLSMIFKIFMDLILIIKYFHDNGYIYRDLKPDNVIIDSCSNIILIDFDSLIKTSDEPNTTTDFSSIYCAPEIKCANTYSYKCDIYSLGKMMQYLMISKGNENFKDINKIEEIINRCTQYNVEDRPTIHEIYKEMSSFCFKPQIDNTVKTLDERISQFVDSIYECLKVPVPVLLQCPNGVSKKLAIKIALKILGNNIIKFKLSSETDVQNLLNAHSNYENTTSEISKQKFLKAFKEGKILLIDEFNLASPSFIRSISEALDRGSINIRFPGKNITEKIDIHPDFRLIAIQNLKKISYTNRIHDYFQKIKIINFPRVTTRESMGISKMFTCHGGETISFMNYQENAFHLKNGDIIIDCGFSKLFTEIDSSGTRLFINNLTNFHSKSNCLHSLIKLSKNITCFDCPGFNDTQLMHSNTIKYMKDYIKDFLISYKIDPMHAHFIKSNLCTSEYNMKSKHQGDYIEQNEITYNIYNNLEDDVKIKSLSDDPILDQKEPNINDILKFFDTEIQKKEIFTSNKSIVEENNFIFTEGAEERLQKLLNYLTVGVPVLLEGPTGSSKTFSSEIVCKLLGKELISFNLSSETKTQDLIGRYFGDENSWAGISQQDGPFLQAFKEGKVLLLDEVNLASESVLQCIEKALDSGVLSIEIPGRPLKSINMHKDFRVIATQNPNKGLFANKRQNLGIKFYSRFQVIEFPAFTEGELLLIGNGLAEKFGYNNHDVINDLVKFHYEWSNKKEIQVYLQCFTIREIAATVRALSEKESIYDTIMTIYGARYDKNRKELLKNELKKYPRLINDTQKTELPDFPGCYINDSLITTVKSALFSLKNGRNIILMGKEGCGKTQVAHWISEYYNSKIKDNENDQQSFFCVCTEEIKVADLVGHQAPSRISDGTSELIKWQDGFLTKAIKLGKCCVLDSLDEAPSTVTERLNNLLDQKYDKQKKFFEIPENSDNPRVPIKDSFRILATANIDKICQMSPAFLNRFTTIFLENQINDSLTMPQYYDLIKTLLNKHCSELSLKEKSLQNKSSIKYSYKETIIPIIYEKVKNEKNIALISKLCCSVITLLYAFGNNSKISEKDVVEFGFQLLQRNGQFIVNKEIEDELLSTFNEIDDNSDEPFFYKDSPSLRSFLAKLAAYSIIKQPVFILGPTGVGKTSAARVFARMRPHKSSYKIGFQMHSFNSCTKVSDFFGSTTLLDGKVVFHDGALTKSLKKGLIFIADELNLSSPFVMKSLALVLDPTIGKNVFIPKIGQIVDISPEFHFIACQNELGTLGRNVIPDSISHRFVYIDYPQPEMKDIQKICINISKENFENKDEFKPKDEELAFNIAKYMMKLNERKLVYIPQWSLRDITKLFRRIYSSKINNKFINITPLHHVLFYTMSVVSPDNAENVLNEVLSIMKTSFNLDDKEVIEYIECYKAQPEIKEVKNQGLFLMKKKSGISIDYEKNLIVENAKLPSLLNAIFQVHLSDDREPILLMGNSGFKTFLASHFLPRAKIITLNQETNVAQLLGTSGFMTNSEAKYFYIEYICKIIQRIPLIYELKEKWKNGNLVKNDILPLIQEAKKGLIPVSFHYALDHLAEKLFDDQNDNNQKCVLSNATLEFCPGLFLNSIWQGQSIILRNLSNLPTIVLERFNDLFSGKQNITLSEDIHNTFTPPDDKELTNFNDTFRVFATCPANSPSRLSEAVLSRFTVILVPEYSSSEQEIVLKSYIQKNKLCFSSTDTDIDILSRFVESCYNKLKIQFTFQQIIKVIEITSKLNNETSDNCQKLNTGIALYRVLGGFINSKKKKEALFEQIKSFFDIPDVYITPKNECPLKLQQKGGITGVFSDITNLFIKYSLAHECKVNIAFTESFNDLLDLIHMALVIHSPLILEGPPGQGKHTAIYYIADMLNIEIVHIMISQSTKVEDLFGKKATTCQSDGIHVEMVETQFVKIIKSSNDSDKRFLIILENINSSSPALLNALVPVFNSHSTSILLPNGSTIEKGKFDIIGIFNTQQMLSSKDELPSSLINSSIYHVVQGAKKPEILQIILTKFKYSAFTDEEANRFYEHFNQARSISSKESTSMEVFTLNDIDKYLLFRKLTKKFFDETTISQMVFAYKFSSDEMIQMILKELKLENMKFNPIFSYGIPPKYLNIRISDNESNILRLPLITSPKSASELYKINSLTLPQKHCLVFLACSLLSKRSCVIQGDTASGKSYLIRLFSRLIGAKLNVFQMNSDSDISMLAEQLVLNDEISQKDIQKIKKALADLIIDERIKSQIEDVLKIDVQNPKTLNPKSLKKLLEYIKDIESTLPENYIPDIKEATSIIKDVMNPVNRFEHKESAFVHALRNGEWVLIDGIEYAPSEIADKISLLCGDNTELNLFEYEHEFFFSKSKNSSSKNRIHDNFHLFITFNPNAMGISQKTNLSFLAKSLTFSLPAIDDRIENSAQLLHGSLINLKYPPEISKELAARFASMHQFAKLESQKNPGNFAGNIQFNARTIKFAIMFFAYRNQQANNDSSFNIARLISLSIKSFYWNSYTNINNTNDFQKNCMLTFKKNPSDELLSYIQIGDMTPEMRNKNILILLRNIQKSILGNQIDSSYSLSYFLDLCCSTRISDLQYVQYHVNDTIKIMKSNSKDKDLNKSPLLLYGLLDSINSLSPKIPIKQEYSFLSLKDEELRNNKSIVIPLTKIDLLIGLLNDKLFSEKSSILFDNELYAKIINHMSIIAKHYDKKLIAELFKEIKNDTNLIDFIDQAFLYFILKDTKLSRISYWLPLAKILIKQGIAFSYTIDNTEISFNELSTSDFSVHLIMNEKDNLSE